MPRQCDILTVNEPVLSLVVAGTSCRGIHIVIDLELQRILVPVIVDIDNSVAFRRDRL